MDFEEFVLKQTEWRGTVNNVLKNMNEDIKEIKVDIKEIKKANVRRDVRTATIAGTVSTILLILSFILENGLG